jgi:Mor family transcriptional regulator
MSNLIEKAKQLADDIDEYAPDTNIALMIRDLVLEIEILQRKLNEQTTEPKNPAKSRKG